MESESQKAKIKGYTIKRQNLKNLQNIVFFNINF